ncbi:MAG TPA: thioredoxin domain-containing protein, partial [Thermoanaerobaculia bacterium]
DLLAHLETAARGPAGGEAPGPEALENAVADCARHFDRAHGGFGSAPKFPPAMKLELLLRSLARSGEPAVRNMCEVTLTRMAEGGMYDQLGGGFHRYSVDERWLVPHFEKMLYDNALLAKVYLFASRELGNPAHERIARETLDYLLREMTPPGGGFFAAQDADSEGEEGAFYVWTPEELTDALGEDAGRIAAARFGVTPEGNFEGRRTVLSIVRSVAELASEFGRPEAEIERVLADAREKLYAVRSRRVPPGTDDKLLTDWSALAISAFALAGRMLPEPRYEAAARGAADRILSRCRPTDDPSALLHREREGEAAIPAFASDYANLIEALLDLYETTFEARYFREAVALQRVLDEGFADPDGGYLLAAKAHDGLVLLPREMMDGATPSSNSVSAMNLLRLHSFTGERRYRDRAEAVFSRLSVYATRAPSAVPRLLSALDYATSAAREVVLAGKIGRPDFEALRAAVFEGALWNRVIAHADGARSLEGLSPLVEGRAPDGGAARAWVCEDFACRVPTTDPSELAAALHV